MGLFIPLNPRGTEDPGCIQLMLVAQAGQEAYTEPQHGEQKSAGQDVQGSHSPPRE